MIDAGGRRSFRPAGALLVLFGAALELLSFRFFDWYQVRRTADSAGDITFATLRSSADQLGNAGAATAYFDWLAWLLLIVLIAVGVAATLPVRAADALRVAGFLIGVIGLGATWFAITQLRNAQEAAGGDPHSPLFNSTWGLWAAFLGFLLGAVGAALGPVTGRRVQA